MKNKYLRLLPVLLCVCLSFTGCADRFAANKPDLGFYETVADIPAFDGETPYIEINGGEPLFDEKELITKSYESYSRLDSLGRCGVANAVVGVDIMPTEERGSIGQVKPTGWHTVKYDDIDGKHLYNRCHLIGYQLTGENANECNLITGTRYMNTEGMLPFENEIAEYVRETENHVAYRVTPIFDGENLLASGVQLEAFSVEDDGRGVCFNVYVYNNQPGIEIEYATGESREIDQKPTDGITVSSGSYAINTNSKKIHRTDCSSVRDIAGHNYGTYKGDINNLLSKGYSRCKSCNP